MFIDRYLPAKHNVSSQILSSARFIGLIIVLGVSSTSVVADTHLPGPPVAIASSLRALWPSLMDAYQQDTDATRVRASFASSGLLSTQILHGAPFELFLSADLATVERVLTAGKSRDIGVSFARGGLSLVRRTNSEQSDVALSMQTLRSALAASPDLKLAMPNPRHAPYGRAAQQVLSSLESWPLQRGMLLSAENASQSLQYALSGAANFALVPTTLVTPVPASLEAIPVPAGLYHPVDHRVVAMVSSSQSAGAFMHWLPTDSAQSVLRRFGLMAAVEP